VFGVEEGDTGRQESELQQRGGNVVVNCLFTPIFLQDMGEVRKQMG
jgi:hypothetical protein